ncbi:FtsH extracellular protease family [Euphorbia peplus]|nr:FtsH extracellular protease family [Euphorbia peplus]
MASIPISTFSQFSQPLNNPLSPSTHTIKITTTCLQLYSNSRSSLVFSHNFRVFSSKCYNPKVGSLLEPLERGEQSIISTGYVPKPEKSLLLCITKPIVYALLCVAIGFCSIGTFPAYATVSTTVASEVKLKKNENENEEFYSKDDHEYSGYTRSLLQEVSSLIKCIEETRRGNGGLWEVRSALKAVKAKKEGLQGQIMEELHSQVMELKRERDGLENRAEEIMDQGLRLRREYESLEGKERMEELEETMRVIEEEYGRLWDRIGDVKDAILRTETVAMSIGVRELCFIERECEDLVKRLNKEMKQKNRESLQKGSVTKLSRSEIQKN